LGNGFGGSFFAEKIARGGGGLICCFAWVFEGGFGTEWVLVVVFCGENVAECVAKLVEKLRSNAFEK
jgi:hypothetical protein